MNIIFTIVGIFGLAAGVFFYWQNHTLVSRVKKKEAEMNHRMFELTVLKELGERIGYSLNIENIIDVITASLNQFIKYSAVSYMLVEPEKIVFKVNLEKSVNREFINDIRTRMLGSLSALLNREFNASQVTEVLSGVVLSEELKEPVRSFFNIPLVISEKVVGVLTVSNTQEGLYKEEEMTVLYKIINQASRAITKLQSVVMIEQQKLNSMVESMAEGVVMTDKDYRVVVANPKAIAAVGIEKGKDVTIFDFIDKLGGKFDIRGRLEESVRQDKVLEIPEVLIRDRFYQIFVSPVKSSYGLNKGQVLGGVVIFHDITSDKSLEKIRDDFSSMIVHELRSPLDNIKKMAEVIKSHDMKESISNYVQYVDLIHNDSLRMLNLVNNLLDIAKLEAGKFEVRKESSDIKKVVDDRISFFDAAAKISSVAFETKFETTIPLINFDPARITQVLTNLISNALKFTRPGSKISVHSFIHRKGKNILEEVKNLGFNWYLSQDDDNLSGLQDSLVVAVSHPGAGIPKDKMEVLFSKFGQLKNQPASGNVKGTGLGLVIVKGVVGEHGGVVGVGSEEGVGVTFYFTLPL